MIDEEQLNADSLRRRSDHRVADRCAAPWLALPPATRKLPHCKQTAHDILNVCGKMAHGIEVELAGVGAGDVFRAFYLNRHGVPGVFRTVNTVFLRFESFWRTGIQSLSLTKRSRAAENQSRPYAWEIALLGSGGSERLCLEISTCEIVATYRWLVEADETGKSLVTEFAPAFIHDARASAA